MDMAVLFWLFLILSKYNTSIGSIINTRMNIQPKIVSGSVATPGQFPYQVHLIITSSSFSTGSYALCGGSIKNASYVITAAHCVTNMTTGQLLSGLGIKVTAGTTYLSVCGPYEQEVMGDRIWVNPDWNTTLIQNDTAIIRLSQPLQFSHYIQPINLAEPYSNISNVSGCIASGWGNLYSGASSTPAYLYWINQTVYNAATCSQLMNTSYASNQLCALGRNGTGICQGDSGGPIACNINGTMTLVGITSFEYGLCGQGKPDFYSAVGWFIPFFDANGVSSPLQYTAQNQTILGAVQATMTQFPFFLRLYFSTGGSTYYCAGTLLNVSFAITTQSCVLNGATAVPTDLSIQVVAGKLDANLCSPNQQMSNVRRLWLAPSYTASIGLNNIALFQLTTPFNATDYVNGISLPQPYANFTAAPCQLVGLGVNATSLNAYSIGAAVSANATCYAAYLPNSALLQSSQICGMLETGDSTDCLGDTGSPLVCVALSSNGTNSTVLAGVLSNRASCSANQSIVLTATSYLLSFLTSYSGSGIFLTSTLAMSTSSTPTPSSSSTAKLATIQTTNSSGSGTLFQSNLTTSIIRVAFLLLCFIQSGLVPSLV